jgi:hypothetical protein
MKSSLILVLGLVMLLSACAPAPYYYGPAGPPPGVVVAVDDQPYYVHGPYYIEHGHRWVWVGGHWGHRHGRRIWVHGHYIVRA